MLGRIIEEDIQDRWLSGTMEKRFTQLLQMDMVGDRSEQSVASWRLRPIKSSPTATATLGFPFGLGALGPMQLLGLWASLLRRQGGLGERHAYSHYRGYVNNMLPGEQQVYIT
jgi:hypothetical protein